MMADRPKGVSVHRAKRSLGQNFLVNSGVRDKILVALAAGSDDWIVEVGPGTGMLTSPLTRLSARVVAVELDQGLALALPERVECPEKLEVVVQDGTAVDYHHLAARASRPVRVVGNLPFGAASAILRRALDQPGAIQELILMFQREVAHRLVARPATRSYGALSVVSQQRAGFRRLFDVAPGSFRPKPRVWASVVRIVPLGEAGLSPCCLACHDKLVRAAFGMRRKTLQNCLKKAPWPWSLLLRALELAVVDPGFRAQQVSVSQYAVMAEFLCQQSGCCVASSPARDEDD